MAIGPAAAVRRRCLAISAVNFTEGGPLTVLRNFVAAACEVLPPDWDIVVFVHDRRLLSAARARLIEIPHTKRSWRLRILVEYRRFRQYARTLQPDLWVSLHDMSPDVGAVPQVVYCHNPVAFHRLTLREAFFQPTLLVFRLAYAWLYRINLHRNRAVIVQQSWLRDEFRRWVRPGTQIIVAHPVVPATFTMASRSRATDSQRATFLYPTLPRPYKNVELICHAVEKLESAGGWHSEVLITLEGTENRYARWLLRRVRSLNSVRLIGRQSAEQMRERYLEADCLLFPSRLETWGLPITEAKSHGLPMFVANLPYARETVGDYESADFIDIDDPDALAAKLLAFQHGRFNFEPVSFPQPAAPFVSGWAELIALLTGSIA
jgi:glycosyltransferase involved in cell wall biosynthesis